MNDRELLELAAKAAGIERSVGLMLTDGISVITTKGKKWNPLTDDGDALRLAVKLSLNIFPPDDDDPNCVVHDFRGIQTHIRIESYYDHYAAIRRAIVLAAAEIGKG